MRRENQDEDINSTPPPCPLPPPPPETTTQEEEEEEVYREEGRIARYRGLWESRFAGKFGSFDDQSNNNATIATPLAPLFHSHH